MTTPTWQLETPLEALIFDCDGTLSTIEGIDELALNKGLGKQVASLTAEAMDKSGMNPALYKQRLDWVKPTQEQVLALGMSYYTHRIFNLDLLIATLRRFHKTLYIVSSGLAPAVTIFGQLLKIPRANIFAVDIEFDDQGHFLDFDHHSPLVTREGKRLIVSQLKMKHREMAYIGDGINDCVTADLVSRFIGYGGAFYRENIAALCNYYIKTVSLAPLLPLTLTATEYEHLLPEEKTFYAEGLQAIEAQEVKIEAPSS